MALLAAALGGEYWCCQRKSCHLRCIVDAFSGDTVDRIVPLNGSLVVGRTPDMLRNGQLDVRLYAPFAPNHGFGQLGELSLTVGCSIIHPACMPPH
jgi:hypothetical protein